MLVLLAVVSNRPVQREVHVPSAELVVVTPVVQLVVFVGIVGLKPAPQSGILYPNRKRMDGQLQTWSGGFSTKFETDR